MKRTAPIRIWLKRTSDTGAGLERFACILQNVDNLFEVDTIRAILDYVCQLAKVNYGHNEKTDTAIRVITDHIRSTVMMVSDGIVPSNEGRGYVLRRLLRRAARFGRMLGIEGSFLHDVARIVIRESASAYPELIQKQEHLTKIIRIEEERFAETILQGSAILDSCMAAARSAGRAVLSGEEVFRLHDTYGFPLDLTREIAQEQDLQIDEDGFRLEMNRQKDMARKALREKAGSAWSQASLPESVDRSKATIFTGYERLEDQGQVLWILTGGSDGESSQLSDSAEAGQTVRIITDQTPFITPHPAVRQATSAKCLTDNCRLSIQDTTKTPEGLVQHAALGRRGQPASRRYCHSAGR